MNWGWSLDDECFVGGDCKDRDEALLDAVEVSFDAGNEALIAALTGTSTLTVYTGRRVGRPLSHYMPAVEQVVDRIIDDIHDRVGVACGDYGTKLSEAAAGPQGAKLGEILRDAVDAWAVANDLDPAEHFAEVAEEQEHVLDGAAIRALLSKAGIDDAKITALLMEYDGSEEPA
jgi:hypothetical protein